MHAAIGLLGESRLIYIHSYGEFVRSELEIILNRDGADALEVLLGPGKSWRFLSSDPYYVRTFGTFIPVPGYGDQFDSTPGSSISGRIAARYDWGIQYIWKIDPITLAITAAD